MNKKKLLVLMLSLFIFCFTINLSVSASGGGRGTYEDDNHNTEVIDGNYRKADELGGYGGQVDVHYDVNGQVQYNGQTIDVNVTLESYTKYMDLHSLGLYDPRNDLSSLYTYGGMGPNSELWAKLAADTGIGTAADWGNGNIKILDSGLHASINLDIHLTAPSNIGDYRVADGVLNLSFPPASADLQALMTGLPLTNDNGTVMLGKATLKALLGKQDTVNFLQLLEALKDAGIDVDKLIPDPDPDPDPKKPEPPEPTPKKLPGEHKLQVTFTPPTCDWTNDPYDVRATVSGVYNREDSTSIVLVNCYCHGSDTACGARYCGGHSVYIGEEQDDNGNWHNIYTTEYRDDNCCSCSYVDHASGRGQKTGSCGSHGNSTVCRAWAHEHNRYTAKWAWELGVVVSDSRGECRGSIIGTEGQGTATLHWKIGITGSWTAMAYFKCSPNQTREGKVANQSYQSWPHDSAPDKGDGWRAKTTPTAEIEKTSGPYKFDDVMPVLTVSTGAYGVGGTHSSNATVDAKSVFGNNKSKYWTNKSIEFSVSLSDAHSGPDMEKSFIEINGQRLNSPDSYGACGERKSMGSFTLTKSGEYKIHFHCEDRAKLGCTEAEDHVANMFDVYYYVYIDKIPPVIRYGFNDDKVMYNSKHERWETSGELTADRVEPAWWINASDMYSIKCPKYATSDLSEAWAYTTQDKEALSKPKEFAKKGHKIPADDWSVELISDDALKNGYEVYLIIYARDNAGNESYTTTEIAKRSDYVDQHDPDHLAPKNQQKIEDTNTRKLPTSMVFINRSKIMKDGATDRGPLEITRVFDVNWEGTITLDNPAGSSTFAVYRNKINDMIGLGYRVNFRYFLIGFGIDKGDKCTLGFELYGHKGSGYEKLDIYLQNPDGQTYTKVDASHEYYRRTYEQNKDVLPKFDEFTKDEENNMIMNEGIYVQGKDNPNDTVLYFNYTIPATAKFKYSKTGNPAVGKGSDKDWYTGTEVLVKLNLWSKKYMDPDGKILYSLLQDSFVPWGPNGQNKQFYGLNNTVPSLGRGQAFWYDATSTAITDISGHKSN